MVAPAEPTGTPIEALFRPSTRLCDTLTERLDGNAELEGLPELLPNLTLQDILASGITWKDLCDYLRDDQIVWTAPDV
jgi:hypothetical protein